MDTFRIALVIFLFQAGHDTNAAFITANPSAIFPGITPTLTINCNLRLLISAISDVFILQIEKTEQSNTISLATISHKGITIDNGYDPGRMNATGDLDLNGQGPYIKLTINKPTQTDEGIYVCSASTTDRTGTLVTLNYQTNVTGINVSTVDQLAGIVMSMASEISAVREENKNLRNTLTDSERRLIALENKPCNCQTDTTSITQELYEITVNFTQEMMTHENVLSQLTNEMTVLQGNQSSLTSDLERYGQTTHNLVNDLVYTTTTFDKYENRLKVLEAISTEQYSQIAQLSGIRTSLGFSYISAVLEQSNSIISFHTKVADNILGYDATSGAFVAPKTGLYLFSLTLASIEGSIEAAIQVKQQLVAYVLTSDTQQYSTSAVVSMSQGDTAKVKVTHVYKVPIRMRNDSCMFSGVYLGIF